jgi:hypothetical protein
MDARVWLVVAAACSSRDAPTAAPATPPAAPAAPPRDAAVTVAVDAALARSYVVAWRDEDRIGTYTVSKTGVVAGPHAALPEVIEDAMWLDADHLAVVGVSGQVYRVTGTTIERYKMPRKSAWRAGKTTYARAKFPNKPTLFDDGSAGVALASCVTYQVGDDDPCVDWKAAALSPGLVVGHPSAMAGDPGHRHDDPAGEVTAPPGTTIEIASTGSAVDVACTANGTTTHRRWEQNEQCPSDGTATRWLATAPPIVDLVITSNCGEGGDHDDQYVVRACALTDFAGDGSEDDNHTYGIAWGDDLWGYDTGSGWSVRSGDREVGTMESGRLIARP